MRFGRRGPTFDALLAASMFAAVAVATTGVVRGSGRQIVDTGRYREYAQSMTSGLVPYRDFDFEYPPAVLPVLLAPSAVDGGEQAYFWGFAALMAAFGAAGVLVTALVLARLERSRRATRGILALLALSPVAFGGVLLTRFDLVPAALVATATLLLLDDRPRSAGIALGLGAVAKWYPLALVPLMVSWTWRRRGRREGVLTGVLALAVLVLAYLPFVVLAPGGVAESLWRQLTRPLQVESTGAGALIVLHQIAGVGAVVETSYGSQNLVGSTPGVVAVALSVLASASVAWIWVQAVRTGMEREALVRLSAAAIVAIVAFGKVLSPQFLVWLLFPLALVGGRRGAGAGACFAVAAIATAVWFPWRYFELPRELDPWLASLVVLRGLALVAALLLLAYPSWRSSARASGSANPNLR